MWFALSQREPPQARAHRNEFRDMVDPEPDSNSPAVRSSCAGRSLGTSLPPDPEPPRPRSAHGQRDADRARRSSGAVGNRSSTASRGFTRDVEWHQAHPDLGHRWPGIARHRVCAREAAIRRADRNEGCGRSNPLRTAAGCAGAFGQRRKYRWGSCPRLCRPVTAHG